jgi:hypothetical protein
LRLMPSCPVADNMLAGVAVICLISWIAAFASVLEGARTCQKLLESISQLFFYVGLGIMVVLIGLMALRF